MEERKRKRIEVNSSIVGSSDPRRLKAKKALLTENHEKNVSFFAAIKAAERKEEQPVVTEKYILSRYSSVFALGHWCPVSKFMGSLVFMYNSSFKFK